MKSARWALAAAALVAPLAACNEETPFEVIEQIAFDPSLGIDLSAMTRLPEGVYIRDDSVGTGPAITAGDSLFVSHTGWLRDGQVFSQSDFCLFFLTTGTHPNCVRQMIEGVEVALEGMALGGRRLMIIPPELGYGANPPPQSLIPPGAVIIFEFEILSVN